MEFIKKITQQELFKIASLNSLSVFFRIVSGYVSSKVIAVFVGPAGMALLGNFRNFLSTVETVGTMGFQNGIIKYVAEYEEEHLKLQKTISTLAMILLPIIALLCGLCLFFAAELNAFLFGNTYQYQQVFRYFSLMLPFFVASSLTIAVLNGFSQFKKVVYLNIIGNAVGLILSLLLVISLKTEGALIAAFLLPAILFFVSLFYLKNSHGLLVFKREYFDIDLLKNFFEYSLMALASSIVGPTVNLLIRKKIISTVGIENAGYWDAMTRISEFYFMFLSTLLTVYFFPKLSKAGNQSETRTVFRKYYQNIIPVFAVGLAVIYVLKEFIVHFLLAKTFLPVTDLFFWRMLGDLFKALSLILGYQFWAKKMTKAFIVTELFSWGLLFLSSIFLIPIFGLQGAVMAHAVEYFVYFIILGIYFRKELV